MAGDAVLLGHRFPTYNAVVIGVVADGSGAYVHALHAQALAEHIVLARQALTQGRTAIAREQIEAAFAYLNRANHTR